MDNLQRYIMEIRNHLLLVLLLNNALVIACWWVGREVLQLNPIMVLSAVIALCLLLSVFLAIISAQFFAGPMRIISQAILHVAPDAANVPAPQQTTNSLGVELVANLVSHIYQLATVVQNVGQLASKHVVHDLKSDFVANSLPLPLMVLDKDQSVVFANQAMCQYVERDAKDVIGQNLYSVLDMSFNSPQTFDNWLKNVKDKEAVANNTWDRVRIDVGDYRTRKQFDLAAYYNKSNLEGFETMLVFFDHSKRYAQDDQALNFVALAVHELRVPVTLFRGYIEALEEELAGKMDPEMASFMTKMSAAAQSLASFINNMLNVARIESNQLVLKLHEEQWPGIVQAAVNDISLRAEIQGVGIETQIDDNLPTVGVDRTGIYEVLINLLDNAIKYSTSGQNIVVKSYLTKDGLVETTVQDFGIGMPAGVMAGLFEKYYRSHRSRSQVGGTGLGLFLSKSIVDAHGGNIWVRSQEGKGSIFGFTVVPYANLAEEQKTGDNKDITRSAHGWIKNHSLYTG